MLNDNNCKLYRSLSDIIHPSISRKNITDYEILLGEGLIPIKVFYPKKEVELKNIIIYIHGEEVNSKFYEALAVFLEQVVLVLDYSSKNSLEDCWHTLDFIFQEIKQNNISKKQITIMGDYTGTTIMMNLAQLFENSFYQELKKVLLSPPDTNLINHQLKNTFVFSNHDEMKVNGSMKLFLIRESIYDFINYADPYTFELMTNQIRQKVIGW